ncbi:50S ribosomal protein L23 [Candidatus Daviesbacteria bacterium]|nr:50S ribosomal protein L23 [Candidatus Daviesbacteria bacterium]
MKLVIEKPIISEKAIKLAGTGWFSFLVERTMRKPEIAKAIEDKFKVNVVAIRVANFKPLQKLQRSRRGVFTVPGFKKAVVKLRGGQKIELFEVEKKSSGPQVTTSETLEVKEKKSLLKGTKVKIEKGKSKKEVEKKPTAKKGGK